MSGEMFFEIIQTRDHFVIHKEGIDLPGFSPTPVPVARQDHGAGVSASRWEGDTFVIETAGFRADDTNRRIRGQGQRAFQSLRKH